jgi:P-type Na+/K+ transporter
MEGPRYNIKSGMFNKEFALDVVVYGVIMGTPPLVSFVIVVYTVGRGNFGTDCVHILDPACSIVYRARACGFLSLALLILLHAFEMKDPYKSIFRMNLLRNKTLFISVVAGVMVLIPTVYIPVLNHLVFKMWTITWEWGLCAASILFYIAGAESYKALKRTRRSYYRTVI